MDFMELQLSLAPPSRKPFESCEPRRHGASWEEEIKCVSNKRCFGEAFGGLNHASRTLPLLVWSGQPNEEDENKGQKKRTSCFDIKNEEEENQLLGWPPVKSWRWKLLSGLQGSRPRWEDDRTAEEDKNGGIVNPMYVKVKMEGVAIARKIDLRLYESYNSLKEHLINMFGKYPKGEKDGQGYTLLYQHKDGDWLLAGDVPWQAFVDCVQRLEIIRDGR